MVRLAQLVFSLATVWLGIYMPWKLASITAAQTKMEARQEEVHDLVNSVSEKLRAAESAEARAEGELEGAAAERARQGDKP